MSIYDNKFPAAKSSRGRDSLFTRTPSSPGALVNVDGGIDLSEIQSQHGTLVGSTVTTVTFSDVGSGFRIQNRDSAGGDGLFYTLDGVDPTVGGAGSVYVPPGGTDQWPTDNADTEVTVKLISSGTPDYSVEAW